MHAIGMSHPDRSQFSGFGLLDSRTWGANKEAGVRMPCMQSMTHHAQDTPGNLEGDGLQLGATFVIEKGL